MQAMFSTTIMWLRDTGILNKLKFDVMNPPIPIPDPKLRHKQPLILRQLSIIIIILVVGLSIALVVFLCEVWITFLSRPPFLSRSRSDAASADLGRGEGADSGARWYIPRISPQFIGPKSNLTNSHA